MHVNPQNILDAFNQLPEIEKHALASEIIKQVATLDIPPLTDEALTEIADALFVEHDKMEVEDAKAKSFVVGQFIARSSHCKARR